MQINKYVIGSSKYQGELEIMKNLSSGELFVQCSEIDTNWLDPEKAIEDNKENVFKAEQYEFAETDNIINSRHATWDEIKAAGWDKYVINKPF